MHGSKTSGVKANKRNKPMVKYFKSMRHMCDVTRVDRARNKETWRTIDERYEMSGACEQNTRFEHGECMGEGHLTWELGCSVKDRGRA